MPKIVAVSTANPKNQFGQEMVKEFAKTVWGNLPMLESLLPVFDNALVKNRHFSVGPDWMKSKHSFTETNNLYIETSLELAKKVTLDVAFQSGVSTEAFDVVFFISTTGLSTPSIDARLFNQIPLNPHIKRVPIWGLGCAGGAAGLSRAFEYLKAFPKHRALVMVVELCSLSFQLNDPSKMDIVSAALFGDGAAACSVFGDEVPFTVDQQSCPSIIGCMSTIYPNTLEVMSWRITEDGFKVQLSQDIPAIANSLVKKNIDEFLQERGHSIESLSHYIFHPGGAKVLQAYANGLDLPVEKLAHSYGVLRDFGNMSSVTVFFVLKRFLEDPMVQPTEYGLVGALGPGFSSELLLLKWD